jgi:WD40 repeat protein
MNNLMLSLTLVLRSISVVGLVGIFSYTYAMENDDSGYRKVCTMQAPRTVTLATNNDHIAIGTAFGPVKLYDSAGIFKTNISHWGDGGLLFYKDKDNDNKLTQANLKGNVCIMPIYQQALKKSFDLKRSIYCVAEKDNQLFFGSDDTTIYVWDCSQEKIINSYTGDQVGHINTMRVTDKEVLSASSTRSVLSKDRETGKLLWFYNSPSLNPLYALTNADSLCYAGFWNGELVIAYASKGLHERVNLRKYLYSLALLKSGYLAVGHYGSVGLYDIRKIRYPVIEYFSDNKDESIILLEPTEKGFVSVTDNGTVDIWEETEQK